MTHKTKDRWLLVLALAALVTALYGFWKRSPTISLTPCPVKQCLAYEEGQYACVPCEVIQSKERRSLD